MSLVWPSYAHGIIESCIKLNIAEWERSSVVGHMVVVVAKAIGGQVQRGSHEGGSLEREEEDKEVT